jgi:2-keto-4-pentenoate hydratase/2-oxohepta-3-ene-1,7-dioic acid hydratase in catechol pathway
MKLATFVHAAQETIGVVRGERIVPVGELGDVPGQMVAFIQGGPAQRRALAEALDASAAAGIPLDEVELLAPIPRPPKNVICLGLNYAAHAAESAGATGGKASAPDHLIAFTKAPTSINRPFGDIPFDPLVTEKVDWEVELGVVIGVPGRGISVDEALNHVFGYTVVNDISARDIQRNHRQYFLGKSLDGYCPMGPWIVTADEIPDPQHLWLRTYVNGELKQDGNTADQIFDVATTISVLSRGMMLEAGDVIATGTPDGVGFARTPPEFLRPGDEVRCEIESIGAIANRVIPLELSATSAG